MEILVPKTLAEALALMAERGDELTPIAGGTDVLVSWHSREHESMKLLDLSRLGAELGSTRFSDEHLHLGALATYWEAIDNAQIREEFPLLVAAAKEVGAIQIQTRGTWAGNIGNSSPAADGVPALLACDAIVVLRSKSATVEVPLHEYWTGYKQTVREADQLIIEIKVPRRERDFQHWHKVGSRAAQAITKVGIAMAHDAEGWRIAANSVAPYVVRCRAVEKALDEGRKFDRPEDLEELLAADVAPIDDIRSTGKFRRKVLARIIYFGLAEPSIKSRAGAGV